MKLKYIKIAQPIGTYYICTIKASVLINCSFIHRRDYNPQLFLSSGGIQRKDSRERIKQIKKYCSDPDATFPSSIIVTCDLNNIKIDNNFITFDENDNNVFEIIDGQHRILGIGDSEYKDQIELPLVVMPSMTEEEKAYVFSTINSNQKRIDPSLIYDLFGVSRHRSPYRTMHEIARAINSEEGSPFFRRLKMLGRKQLKSETISQGTFVNDLIVLISKKPKEDAIDIKNHKKLKENLDLPLRYYFLEKQDDIIYKIILNYFSAARDTFSFEWEDPKTFIVNRSTGFGGLCLALNSIVKNGLKIKKLDYNYFKDIMQNYKIYLDKHNKVLNSENYPSNISIQRTIKKEILLANDLNTK